jgi:hypothetical protein
MATEKTEKKSTPVTVEFPIALPGRKANSVEDMEEISFKSELDMGIHMTYDEKTDILEIKAASGVINHGRLISASEAITKAYADLKGKCKTITKAAQDGTKEFKEYERRYSTGGQHGRNL